MSEKGIEGHHKVASWLTLFCAASLLIGGVFAWSIVKGGGPEALGAIIPLIAIGGIHLLCAPVAIFHAYKRRQSRKNIYIYSYFLLFVVLTFLVSGPEVIVYVLILALLIITPILFSAILSFIKTHR